MSETSPDPAPPEPETDPEIKPAAPPEAAAITGQTVRRPVPIGGIFGLIVILLLLGAGGDYYVWQREASGQKAQTAAVNNEINGIRSRMTQLAAQVAASRKAPAEVKIPAAFTDRVDGLQQTVTALASRLKTGQTASSHLQSEVQPRLDALGKKLGDLQSSLQSANSATDSKLNDLQTSLRSQNSATDAALGGLQSHARALDAKLDDMQSQLGGMKQLAARARRLDRLAMASLALQTGESLGAIKDAPPALARYASQPPPTEAELRQEFSGAAQRALAAGGEVRNGSGYWQKLKMRVAGLVTLRKGDQVLVGSEADGVLGAAQSDLDADNLHQAVTTLQALSPQAQAAMQDWLDRANGLLAARRALAAMAEQT